MENLFENWRAYTTDDFRLYHFSRAKEQEITLDPAYFLTHRQSYSRKDYQMSSYPRTFFYVDLNDAEAIVSSSKELYYADVPADKIYDMMSDPDEIKKISAGPYGHGLDYDKLFQNIVESGYIGAYYTIGDMNVVVLFEPIEVTKVEDE
jgi:hypothetical protein